MSCERCKIKRRAGRKLMKSNEHAYNFAFVIAKRWGYTRFLTRNEIREEIRLVLGCFEILGIVPWMGVYRALIQARLYRRLKDKGYRILNKESAAKIHAKAGLHKLIKEVSYDETNS